MRDHSARWEGSVALDGVSNGRRRLHEFRRAPHSVLADKVTKTDILTNIAAVLYCCAVRIMLRQSDLVVVAVEITVGSCCSPIQSPRTTKSGVHSQRSVI